MARPVKRTYNSPHREAQARATRNAIRVAAQDLFLSDGYGATTIKAIADRAEVAPQTVYSQFGTKAAIAKEMLDVAIAGDDEPIPIAERDFFIRVHEDGIDGCERLRRYAHSCRRVLDGAGSAFEIVRRGADGDPELAELWQTNQAVRRRVVAEIIDRVLETAAPRRGLDRDRAVDLAYLLHSPEVFHVLVEESGWSLDQYEEWLARSFVEQILGIAPPAP